MYYNIIEIANEFYNNIISIAGFVGGDFLGQESAKGGFKEN